VGEGDGVAAGLGPPRIGVGVGLAGGAAVGDGATDWTGWGFVGELSGSEHAQSEAQAKAKRAREAPVRRRSGTA
jgi:hypothetical protein